MSNAQPTENCIDMSKYFLAPGWRSGEGVVQDARLTDMDNLQEIAAHTRISHI